MESLDSYLLFSQMTARNKLAYLNSACVVYFRNKKLNSFYITEKENLEMIISPWATYEQRREINP